MRADELTQIREAINDDTLPYTHLDDDLKDMLDLLGNAYLVIAHYMLSDAIAITSPTAPTAPTLDEPPVITAAPSAPSITSAPDKSTSIALQKWQAQVANDKYLADLETRKWETDANNDITEWREKSSNLLSKYGQQVSSYQAERSVIQMEQELRRTQAQLYLELAKDSAL